MTTCYECGAAIGAEEFSGTDSQGRPLCTRCEEARHPPKPAVFDRENMTYGKWMRGANAGRSTVLRDRFENPEVTREGERERIIASFVVFDVPADVQGMILEALDSTLWDWFLDCDGCTCVSEEYWPTKYFPPCLLHDFDCWIHRPWFPAADRFYRVQVIYGISKWDASLRRAGVKIAWCAYYKWRNAWLEMEW